MIGQERADFSTMLDVTAKQVTVMVKRITGAKMIAGALGVICLGSNFGPVFKQSALAAASPHKGPQLHEAPKTSAATDTLTPDERVNINVYKTANKSVVYITTVVPTEDVFSRVVPSQGEGSGCILTADGYVLTNYHVVKDAQFVRVTLSDGSSYTAQVTGIDPEYDTAVIKIDVGKKLLMPMKLGDSSQLEVGRRVFVIGNPFGFDRTMTTGVVSAINRTANSTNGRVIKGIIQTDAAINPGNSGGPLLNTRGEMIALATAIYTRLGSEKAQWSGLGFAIPVNTLKRVFPQLIAFHHPVRPDLGIKQMCQVTEGLQVMNVDPSGPAAEAGITGWKITMSRNGPFTVQSLDSKSADVIVKIDEVKVGTVDDLLSYIESKKPGQVVTLTVLRQGKILKLPVKLTTSATAGGPA